MILLGVAIAGALSNVGELWIFGALALAALGHFVVKPLLGPLGLTITPEMDFRIAVIGWPVALLALGWTSWEGTQDVGEVVAVAGFVMAALVALAESTAVAVVWTAVASAAVVVGAVAAGHFSEEAIVAAAAISGGTLTGARLQRAIEVFLHARRRLMRDVSRVPIGDDPFVTADLLLRPLTRWTPLKNPALVWFRANGGSVFLAVAGEDLPPSLGAGVDLPASRDAVLRKQAEIGPWINAWTARDDDHGYSRDISALGINAVAYVPLVFERRVLGVVAAGLSDRADDRSAMAEYVPTLVQFADAAAVGLGPALSRLDADSIASRAIDEILDRRLYRPVFQSVRRLSDDTVVGYEALTRFDSAWSTAEMFNRARLAGRLRDLELATLKAAIEAAALLPVERWLGLNCSAALFVERETLSELIAPIQQEVVIELSEHDVINDYGPIAAAASRLRSGCRLAVDDAGAGFSSLRHILEVRPGFVKIDIGLVKGVAGDITRTALIAGFVRFASDAGFELIAEGIETDADREALARLGVGLGQGFLLDRPRPAAEVVAGHEGTRRVRSLRDRGNLPADKAPSPLAG